MRVDLLTLYALSDKVHAQQRELWRGFLALVMPILLECDAAEFERILETAQCRSVDTMLSSINEPENAGQLVWSVSGTFAELLGFEPELGLAAFLDVNLPTRVHAVGAGVPTIKQNVLVSRWLKSFRELQQRPEFLEITAEWKRAFEVFLEAGEDDELHEGQDADDAESVEATEQSERSPKSA